jgi:hypothetical protein
MKTKIFLFFLFFALITAGSVFASTNSESGHGIHHDFIMDFCDNHCRKGFWVNRKNRATSRLGEL